MKPWAYVIILVAIIGAIGGTYAKGHSAGYDKAKREETEAQLRFIELEVERRTQEWIETQDQAEPVIITEEKIVTEIEYVDREIPVEVEKIVEVKPECRDLGDGYSGLLNKQIRAANTELLPVTDPATDVAGGVPPAE